MEGKKDLREKVRELISRQSSRSLIPLLQRIQAQLGYLPREGLEEVAKHLRIPVSRVYGVATFYSQFTLHPRGRHLVQLCQGTACHVQGSGRILEALERELGLTPGRTGMNGKVSLEVVRCVGCCSLAPVMLVDGRAYGRLTPEKAVETVGELDGKADD